MASRAGSRFRIPAAKDSLTGQAAWPVAAGHQIPSVPPHAETYMFTISDPLGLDLRGEGGAVVVPRGRRHGSCCVPAQKCPRRQLATQPQRKAPAARRHTRDGIVRPLSLGGERVDDIADIIRDADQPGHPVRGTHCRGDEVVSVASRNRPFDLDRSLDPEPVAGRIGDQPLQQWPVAALPWLAVLPVPDPLGEYIYLQVLTAAGRRQRRGRECSIGAPANGIRSCWMFAARVELISEVHDPDRSLASCPM